MGREWPRALRHPDLLAGGFAALAAFGIAALTLRIWRADMHVPLEYSGDSLFILSITRQVLDHAWYLTNDSLGAPFGQHLQDFPVASGDPIHLIALKLIGALTGGDYPLAYNVYFLLGFPLAAASAFLAMRAFDVSGPVAAVCAVLFAVLPFHFTIGAARPFETGYWVIPICCYLILSVSDGRPLFTRSESRRGVLAFATRRSLLTLVLCVAVGSAGIVYFSLFTAILVALAVALVCLRLRTLRAAVPGLAVIALILATIAVNGLPTVVYQLEHGNAAEESNLHHPRDSEVYSLNLAQLLLPIPGDRVEPLERLRNEYSRDVSVIPEVSKEAGLGPIGALGLLFLIGLALAAAVGAVRRVGRWALQLDSAALTVAAILIGTTGGFSALIALLLTPQFRVWQRFYIFIAFFSLLAVAFLLDAALRRLEGRRRAMPLTVALLGAVLVVGAFEQTSDRYIPDYRATAAKWESDRAIVSQIEERLPDGAQVFQLPYLPFPTWGLVGSRGGAQGFDGFRPSLHSSEISWSYGATRSREQDWQSSAVDKPVDLLVPSLAAAGFDGILVYRPAYDDGADRLNAAIAQVTGTAPILTPDGRYAFFDLRRYRERLAATATATALETLGEATLHPVRLIPESGLAEQRQYGAYTPTYLIESPSSALLADNPSSEARTITLMLVLEAGPDVSVDVRLPDGRAGELSAERPFTATLSVPPGASEIELEATGVPDRAAFLVVQARDASLDPFPAAPGGAVFPQTGRTEAITPQPPPAILSPP